MRKYYAQTLCVLLICFLLVSAVPARGLPSETDTTADLYAPLIGHNPVEYAPYGYPLSLWVNVTDDQAVASVQLFYRQNPDNQWKVMSMVPNADAYSAQLSAQDMTSERIEYYIEASDGTNVTQHGSPKKPFTIFIDRGIFIGSVTPDHFSIDPSDSSMTATVTGEGFTEDMTVTVGSEICTYQFITSQKIQVQLPSLPVGKADLQMIGPDAHSIRTNAITYQDPLASVMVQSPQKVYIGQSIRIPVTFTSVAAVTDIAFSSHMDPMLFEKVEFVQGGANPEATASCMTQSDGTIQVQLQSPVPLSPAEPIGYICAKVRFIEKPVKTTVAVVSAAFQSVNVGTASAQMQVSNAIEIALADAPQTIYAVDGMMPELLDMKLQVDYEGVQEYISLTPGMIFLSEDTPGHGKIVYFHKEAVFEYQVLSKDQVQVGITTVPDKLHYRAGELLDTAGLTVSLSRLDGTVLTEVRNYTLSGFDPDQLGTQQLVVSYGEFQDTFSVSVFSSGDVNCDGRITITDMMSIKAHLLGNSVLEEVAALAGDINGDHKITITDFVQIKRHLLGLDEIDS